MLAIAAVVDVALYARPSPVAAKSLAARHHLPPRHLETLLQGLVQANILKGVRGPRGGYELARERRKITAGEVVRTALALSAAEPSEIGASSRLVQTRHRTESAQGGRFLPRQSRRDHGGGSLRGIRSPPAFSRTTRTAAISPSETVVIGIPYGHSGHC